MASTFFSRERSPERIKNVPFFRYIFFIIVLLLLVQVLFPTWRILPLIYGQGTVPLHYNIHFGVDSLGSWWRIFTVPFIGLLFLIINTVIAQVIWKREPMLSYLVVSATLLFEFFLFLAMIFIVLLNISYG